MTVPPQPPPGPAAVQRSVTGRVLLAVGIALAVLVVAWGAFVLADRALATTTTTHETYSAGGVELRADSDVTVHADPDATSVSVDVVQRGGFTTPTFTSDEDGDTVLLTNRCPGWLWFDWTCRGELHAVVPPDTEVFVRSANGDVETTGLAADVDVRSSNGDVLAARTDGDVLAGTSNGRVEVRDVTGDAELRSANGDLEAASVGGGVLADSSNGDVEVSEAGGAVSARTSNGDVEVVDAADDVEARSTNGDVTVVGDGGPVNLTIETTNGTRTVEGATDPAAPRSIEVRSTNGDVAYLAP